MLLHNFKSIPNLNKFRPQKYLIRIKVGCNAAFKRLWIKDALDDGFRIYF